MQEVLEKRISGWMHRRPPTGVAGVAFWLAVWFGLLWLLRLVPGWPGTLAGVLQVLVAVALCVVAIPLLWRLVRTRLLWSLRNKLRITYFLIGFAPVALILTLVLISSYIVAGQFSIHLAETRLAAELNQMAVENASHAAKVAHAASMHQPTGEVAWASALAESTSEAARPALHPQATAFLGGAPLVIKAATDEARTPLGLPAWAYQVPREGFRSLVRDGSDFFLVAVNQEPLADGKLLTLVSSLPVDAALMDVIASGLGRAGLIGGRFSPRRDRKDVASDGARQLDREEGRRNSVFGGSEPPAANLADVRVRFFSTLSLTDWDTGEMESVPVNVTSRPSLLYRQLFGASIGGIVTNAIWIALATLCITFGLIWLLAWMGAAQLSRTVTAWVADLYEATQRVDRGDLQHRIAVSRDDQMAALSQSFNRMTGSLQRLLEEQKEKERLQNELSIAQEVQANLFPQRKCDLERLELHGVCRPARTVSGDYYDFLVFHEQAHDGMASGRETGVGIALGDISGKGISAALLMATLHSAVRAYRFASEEMVYSESLVAGLMASRQNEAGDCSELFESPGRILSLLNRHLYRSTQPEKYATLFLAHYDAASSALTYSNAGQLPPLVLSLDGTIRRLDKGGTVVGLMDGMKYEEDRFVMRPGDILVAYSDGVTEPENEFGDFGEDRLMEVVGQYRREPLHLISTQVMQALDAWIGGEEQPDDITLVLARQM